MVMLLNYESYENSTLLYDMYYYGGNKEYIFNYLCSIQQASYYNTHLYVPKSMSSVN